MAASLYLPSRAPSLRLTITGAASSLRAPQQRRWAQVHDVRRFLVTQQTDDRVLEKYREKLDRKAKEKGLRDIAELKEAYKDQITELKQKSAIPLPGTPSPTTSSPTPTPSTSPFPSPPPAPAPSTPTSTTTSSTHPPASKQPPHLKTLTSYLDLEKISTLPNKEIEALWRLRHAHNPLSLCATIPLPTYQAIEATAKKHPFFILPLPKPVDEAQESSSSSSSSSSPDPSPPTTNADASDEPTPTPTPTQTQTHNEIHLLQWTFPTPTTSTVLFTHLAEYKLRGEFAQPHTTITHHLELAGSKGLVLLQGAVMDGRGVSVAEARWLVLCLQRFYGGVGGEGEEGRRRRVALVEAFGRGDRAFRVEEVVREAELMA